MGDLYQIYKATSIPFRDIKFSWKKIKGRTDGRDVSEPIFTGTFYYVNDRIRVCIVRTPFTLTLGVYLCVCVRACERDWGNENYKKFFYTIFFLTRISASWYICYNYSELLENKQPEKYSITWTNKVRCKNKIKTFYSGLFQLIFALRINVRKQMIYIKHMYKLTASKNSLQTSYTQYTTYADYNN